MAFSKKRKSASTTKSNTPSDSPRRRSESKEIVEKATNESRQKDSNIPADKEVAVMSTKTRKSLKKTSRNPSTSLSKPLLRSRQGEFSSNKTKTSIKKIHKPSPLSLKNTSILKQEGSKQNSNEEHESPKEPLTVIDNLIEDDPASRKWSVSSEILLLKCLADNKPSGIHKHFHMANICHLFNKDNVNPRSSRELWEHIGSMYDLQAIDEMEFSGPDEWSIFQDRILDLGQFQEFDLSEDEFQHLKDKRIKTN